MMPLTSAPSDARPRFYTVGETAEMLRTSAITVYRAINHGEFPAVRVRGRLIVPAKVIDALIDAAIDTGALVDAQDWAPGNAIEAEKQGVEGRPRPGANQTGAGSPVTQHVVRGDASSMPHVPGERSGTPERRRDGGAR